MEVLKVLIILLLVPFNNDLIIQFGHYSQPTGQVVIHFPIAYSSNTSFSLIAGGVGYDARNRNGEPMPYCISSTGFSGYYADPYYSLVSGQWKCGEHWIALGY